MADRSTEYSFFSTSYVVPGEGFEPPTFGLQNRCTTTVLTRPGHAVFNYPSEPIRVEPANNSTP
jgi:hypothetical protein